MSDQEFAVIATRLIWGEAEGGHAPQDTLKRLKATMEEREQYLRALKDLSEALLASANWDEQKVNLAKALLWALHTLQIRRELLFGQPVTSRASQQT